MLTRNGFDAFLRVPLIVITLMNIELIIENAEVQAQEVIDQSEEVRADYDAGHQNCSTESTSAGAIRAMGLWMKVSGQAG